MNAEPSEHIAWLEIVPPNSIGLDSVPACGIPSPTNAMLCDLPETIGPHWLGQHLGTDRRGNLRGWPDKRSRT